jgi:ferric-dicitrate binding protein FerR (iron transport regulator)
MEQESNGHQASADMVATLIQAAGRRTEPPEDAYRQVLDAAMTTLRGKTARRRQRTWLIGAAAAGLAAVSVMLLLQRGDVSLQPRVATVIRTIGAVELRSKDRWQPLVESGGVLVAGTGLRTLAGGGAVIELGDGTSLRLAATTDVQFDGPHHLLLRDGMLYLDHHGSVGTGFRIGTPLGTVSDVGTQFELRVAGSQLRLRVREGRVEIDRAGQRLAGGAGEQLEIDVLGGVTRSTIATTDPAWQWAETMAPAPEIDGRPATELLAWVARETGRRLLYQSPIVEQRAATVILHGNIRHLAPLAALDAMLATTDLEYVIDGDTMEIRARAE